MKCYDCGRRLNRIERDYAHDTGFEGACLDTKACVERCRHPHGTADSWVKVAIVVIAVAALLALRSWW